MSSAASKAQQAVDWLHHTAASDRLLKVSCKCTGWLHFQGWSTRLRIFTAAAPIAEFNRKLSVALGLAMTHLLRIDSRMGLRNESLGQLFGSLVRRSGKSIWVWLLCDDARRNRVTTRWRNNVAEAIVGSEPIQPANRKLKQGGGLLIVERDTVFEVIKAVEQTPDPAKIAKIVRGLPVASQDRSGLIACGLR